MATVKGEKGLMQQQSKMKNQVEALIVEDQETLEIGAEMLQQINVAIKQVGSVLDPGCDSAYAHWKGLTSHRKTFIDPLTAVKSMLNKKTSTYLTEQERLRVEEEDRVRKKAEAEEKEERERLERLAHQAKAEGDYDEADALQDEADTVFVPATSNVIAPTRIGGTAVSSDYNITVHDTKKLLLAICEGRINIDIDSVVNLKLGSLKTWVKLTKNTKLLNENGCRVEQVRNMKGTGR